MLNSYEAMYIVDPALSEQEVEALTKRLESEIVEKGGEIVDLQHLGKKRLAYPVKKEKDGFYFLLYFRLASDRGSELRAGYRLNDSILRFLIIRKSEQELQFAGEKTPGRAGGQEAEREQHFTTSADADMSTQAGNENAAEKE
jgi:small subunit ribosomal protein S6